MTHEEYMEVKNLAKKITQYEAGDNEAVVILAASEKEDSLVRAHNGDASIIVPLLRTDLMRIIREADEENKKAYLQTLINDIMEVLMEAKKGN